MATKKITQDALDKAKARAQKTGKPGYLWDTDVRGFGCRLAPTGHTSYLLQVWSGGARYSDGGKSRRVTFHAESLDAARAQAMAMKANHSTKGIDPVSAKQERRAKQRESLAATKLKDAWELYSSKRSDDGSHWLRTKMYFEKIVIPKLGKETAIRDITIDDIQPIIDKKEAKHPIAARYLFRVLSPFFKFCIQRRYITVSPMSGLVPPPASESRDRSLTEDEIKAFWAGTEKTSYPYDPLHRLLLLTGQRKHEVAGMEWSELDLENKTWIIPASRTKNKKPHIVHLSPMSISIIKDIDKTEGTNLVFPSSEKTILNGFGKAKDTLDALLGSMPHWTLHDLRRTFVTVSNEKGFADPHVIEAAVNHLTGLARKGVAGTYNRAAYLPQRKALFDTWGEYISALVAPKPQRQEPRPANVLAFPAARASI